MIIDGLPTLSAPQGTDEIPVERGTTTYKAALNALPYSFQVNITSGSHDLDDYKTAGLYYFSQGATISNAPNNAGNGWLTVYVDNTGTLFKQVWQRLGSNPNNFKDFYMRLYQGGGWGDWYRIGLDRVAVSLTITRTENNYADATQVGRMYAYKKNGMLYLYGNLQVKPNVSSSDFVEIAKISGWSAVDNYYAEVPPQGNNGDTIMTVYINNSGSIKLYSYQPTYANANTWYRFSACVPEA